MESWSCAIRGELCQRRGPQAVARLGQRALTWPGPPTGCMQELKPTPTKAPPKTTRTSCSSARHRTSASPASTCESAFTSPPALEGPRILESCHSRYTWENQRRGCPIGNCWLQPSAASHRRSTNI